jgi:hypothetical protein
MCSLRRILMQVLVCVAPTTVIAIFPLFVIVCILHVIQCISTLAFQRVWISLFTGGLILSSVQRLVVFKYTISLIFRQAIPQKHVIDTNISDTDSSIVSPRFSGVAITGVCSTYYCHRYISSFCDCLHFTCYTMYQYSRLPESVNNKRDNYYSYLKRL